MTKKVYWKYNTFTETFNTLTETMPHFTEKKKSFVNFSVREISCTSILFPCFTLQLEDQLWYNAAGGPAAMISLWAGLDPPACRLPSWVVISCRLPVQLQEGQPCTQHQPEDYPTKPLLVASADNVAHHQSEFVRRLGQASSCQEGCLWTCWGWWGQARHRQGSAKRFLEVGVT